MKAFQAIADQNPGPDGHPSRNSGEPGYKASVDYVAGLMRQAGYDVTIQTYKFFYFAYTAIPTFSEVSPTSHDFAVTTDWNPGQSTGTETGATLPAGTVGKRYSSDFTAQGGLPPYTWFVVNNINELPPGLTLASSSPDTDNVLTGTPTQAGTFSFPMQVQDSWDNTVNVTFTVTINP